MSIDLKEQSKEVLSTLINKAAEAGEFIEGQAPLVVQELLAYNFAMSLIYFSVFVFTAAASWYGYYRFMKWGLQRGEEAGYCKLERADCEIFVGLIPLVSVVLSLFPFTATTWIQIWLAPRVYLLEYAASLVN